MWQAVSVASEYEFEDPSRPIRIAEEAENPALIALTPFAFDDAEGFGARSGAAR